MKSILNISIVVLSAFACTSPQQHEVSEMDSAAYREEVNSVIDILPLDSSTYRNQKATLQAEVHQFLDSINTLISYTQGLRSQQNKEKLDESLNKLTTIKEVVERHLEEINTTSQKSWDSTMIKRIKIHMDKTKKEVDAVRAEVDLAHTKKK